MRLGDLDALKEAVINDFDNLQAYFPRQFIEEIDNAPTVPLPDFKDGYKQAIIDGKTNFARLQGEREFIEIIARYEPDDIVTYPEYRGKPYYSIHYRENGEEFVGYGTYKIEVLSRYLQDYFFNTPTVNLKDIYQEGHYDGHIEGYTKAINEERPKGKWIPRLHASENDIFVCSVCKRELGYDPSYCPNCGADMRGDSSHGR